MKTVKEIHEEIYQLQQEQIEVIKKQYPLGDCVVYMHGDQERWVTVIGHNRFSPHLKVQGATVTEYWLDARRVE